MGEGCRLHTSLAVYESSPEVGSSRNSTRGLDTSAMPMFVRLHWPPGTQAAWCQFWSVRHTHCDLNTLNVIFLSGGHH